MEKILSIVAAVSFGIVSPASEAADLAQVCSDINSKFVVRISKLDSGSDSVRVKVCQLDSFIESGEEHCGYGIWSSSNVLGKIVDLNGDKHFDLVLSFSPGGLWQGTQAYIVLASCGDDTYVKILGGEGGEGFTSLWVEDIPKNNKWVSLYANRLSHRPGLIEFGGTFEDFDIENLMLEFDSNSFQYSITSKKQTREATENDMVYHSSISPSFEPNVSWGEFPTRFFPSFNCTQARTSVENTICADKNLSRLDFILARNYKALTTMDIGAKLVTDQRVWLKQRNACKTADCLKNAYETRNKELCTNYKGFRGFGFSLYCDL